MAIPVPTVVYGIWIFVAVLTFSAVGAALVMGLRGKGTLVQWRRVKLASSLAGLISVVFLMLTIEGLVRAGFVGEIAPERILALIQLRSLTLAEMAKTCSENDATSGRACSELGTFAQIPDEILIRDRKPLKAIEDKTPYDPSLSRFLDRYNFWIREANLYAEREEDRYVTMSKATRLNLFLLAAMFLVLAVAGAIGEAAFQLRQATDAARTSLRN